MAANLTAPPEVWGGLECSQVLVHGDTRDQFREAGHYGREGDLQLVADLGIRTLRYPLLWATIARGPSHDFTWHDKRFAHLRALGIRPIAGFLHHGCGPNGLHPGNPAFPEAFARYAGVAAARYPWVEDFTPINEPVTTARFAHLYGHWHPHETDQAAFLRAVVASMRATALAMAAIRRHTPGARLVTTDDYGRVFSTRSLAGQAAYENRRRYLGLDLLTGRVRPGHSFWQELMDAGVPRRHLDELADAPCPPDIVGIDHYLTSDRYLDGRVHRHSGEPVGGNGRQRYADVAAARIAAVEPEMGALPRIRELHARYGLPLALTEVHNGCTREEQLRWLMEAWTAARTARAEGIPVRAVTAWALFGSLDWTSLLKERRGHYEVGAFDTRADPPRPTAIAHALADLAGTGDHSHPLLTSPGWWRRAARWPDCPPLLAVDAPASLAPAVGACCAERGLPLCEGDAVPAWGRLRITEQPGGLRLEFAPARDPIHGALTLEADGSLPLLPVLHAALDLAVDGERGRLRADGLGPAGDCLCVRDDTRELCSPLRAAGGAARV